MYMLCQVPAAWITFELHGVRIAAIPTPEWSDQVNVNDNDNGGLGPSALRAIQ